MSKLPSIFLEEIQSSKQHNKNSCYVKDKDEIEEQLKEMFEQKEPVYMKRVQIKTKTSMIETRIYKRKEKELITLDNKIIPINEIEYIKRIS